MIRDLRNSNGRIQFCVDVLRGQILKGAFFTGAAGLYSRMDERPTKRLGPLGWLVECTRQRPALAVLLALLFTACAAVGGWMWMRSGKMYQPFAAVYVALSLLYFYLASMRTFGAFARLIWVALAIGAVVAVLQNMPSTFKNEIRLDLLLIDFVLAPIFGVVAVVAAWLAVVRQMKREKPESPPDA